MARTERVCRQCGVTIKHAGEGARWTDEMNNSKCEGMPYGHRPTNALRTEQKEALGLKVKDANA